MGAGAVCTEQAVYTVRPRQARNKQAAVTRRLDKDMASPKQEMRHDSITDCWSQAGVKPDGWLLLEDEAYGTMVAAHDLGQDEALGGAGAQARTEAGVVDAP